MALHGPDPRTGRRERPALDRFGTYDATDRGGTRRYSLSGEWRHSSTLGLTQVKAYAIDYALDLFSNFTYFLEDPVNGDQFEQEDERSVLGASVTQRFLSNWFGRDSESAAGLQGRLDDIPTVGLHHTQATRRLETIRQDDVTQRSGAALFQTSIQWTNALRTVAGLRSDLYGFDIRSDERANSGRRIASLLSPKLSVVLGPWKQSEVYANWGWGFHSNDARGAVQTRDPRTGEPIERADPLVRAKGTELGLRSLALPRLQTALGLWGLDIDSELLFVGDAGTTEASRPSRRVGLEWSGVFAALPWLTFDADVAWSRARFRDSLSGDRIPGAVEGVASAAGAGVHHAQRSGELAAGPSLPAERRRLQHRGCEEQRHRLLLLLRVPPSRRAARGHRGRPHASPRTTQRPRRLERFLLSGAPASPRGSGAARSAL